MIDFVFYLGLAALMTHEMDAIAQSEWRMLFFFRKLPEKKAATFFIAAHLPLFAGLMWLTGHESFYVQSVSRGLLSLFLIGHAVLHRRLSRHTLYTFYSCLSKSLIYGGGLLGGVSLLLTLYRYL